MDVVCATNLHGMIMNNVLVMFNLGRRMDGLPQTKIGALAHNDDGFTQLGSDFGNSINQLEGIEFVVVNASDIQALDMLDQCHRVVAKDSTIGTTINKGSAFVAFGNMTRAVTDLTLSPRMQTIVKGLDWCLNSHANVSEK